MNTQLRDDCILFLGQDVDTNRLDFCIDMSIDMIKVYLNMNGDPSLDSICHSAIVMLAIYIYNNFDMFGVSKRTEGEVSLNLDISKMPEQIKGMLPKPKVRFL